MKSLLSLSLILGGILLISTVGYADEDDEKEYVGVRECRDCHGDLASNHADSAHVRTLVEIEPDEPEDKEAILGDFGQGEDLRTVEFPNGESRPFTEDDIAYVLGSGRYLQAYLYAVEEEKFAVFPAEWNTVSQSWVTLDYGEGWLDNPAYDFGTRCAGCHVTGLELGDDSVDWVNAGVQCEACHGPGSLHVDIVDDAGNRPDEEEIQAIHDSIILSPDAQTCGQCHSQGNTPDDLHPFPLTFHPGQELLDGETFSLVTEDDPNFWWATGQARQSNMQFNEWLSSAHSNALEDMKNAEGASDECLACHSENYRFSQHLINLYEEEERTGQEPTLPTINDAEFGLTCTTCHNPHADSESEIDFSLRAEPYQLCVSCHSDPDLTDGIHYAMQQMYEGVTVVEQVQGIPSAHFSAENGPDCVSCHMARVPVNSFSLASHSLDIVSPALAEEGLTDTCTECHGEQATPAAMQALMDDIQTSTQSRVEAIRANLTGDEPEWALLALEFLEHDSSQGVHNYAYTDALLDALENMGGAE